MERQKYENPEITVLKRIADSYEIHTIKERDEAKQKIKRILEQEKKAS